MAEQLQQQQQQQVQNQQVQNQDVQNQQQQQMVSPTDPNFLEKLTNTISASLSKYFEKKEDAKKDEVEKKEDAKKDEKDAKKDEAEDAKKDDKDKEIEKLRKEVERIKTETENKEIERLKKEVEALQKKKVENEQKSMQAKIEKSIKEAINLGIIAPHDEKKISQWTKNLAYDFDTNHELLMSLKPDLPDKKEKDQQVNASSSVAAMRDKFAKEIREKQKRRNLLVS